MKFFLHFMFCSIVMCSCKQTVNKQESGAESDLLLPVVQPSELEISIRESLTKILNKDMGIAGYKAASIQLAGLEIIHISRKDYFIDERNNQERDFNRYIEYIEKFKNSHNSIYNTAEIAGNKLKHAAVMEYLGRMIKKSSLDKAVYKVVYYLKVEAKDIKYNQQQTTYLDEEYKKIVADYSHLRTSR